MLSDMALANDEQSIYILDAEAPRVSQHTLDGELITFWSAEELGVREPHEIAVDAQGTLYILERGSPEIVLLRTDGTHARWTLPTNDAWVMEIDSTRGRVYVGGNFNYLYIFDLEGTYLGLVEVDLEVGWTRNLGVGPDGRVYRSGWETTIEVFAPR